MRTLGILLLVLFLFTACSAKNAHQPSPGAAGMPGALGTFEFKPSDYSGEQSFWIDSDGVAPDVAGCHIGTDATGKPNGRMFGEACLDATTLVESNPGEGELHAHGKDVGHPDKFDCNAYCVGMNKSEGSCEAAKAAPCAASAQCVCR